MDDSKCDCCSSYLLFDISYIGVQLELKCNVTRSKAACFVRCHGDNWRSRSRRHWARSKCLQSLKPGELFDERREIWLTEIVNQYHWWVKLICRSCAQFIWKWKRIIYLPFDRFFGKPHFLGAWIALFVIIWSAIYVENMPMPSSGWKMDLFCRILRTKFINLCQSNARKVLIDYDSIGVGVI